MDEEIWNLASSDDRLIALENIGMTYEQAAEYYRDDWSVLDRHVKDSFRELSEGTDTGPGIYVYVKIALKKLAEDESLMKEERLNCLEKIKHDTLAYIDILVKELYH